MIVLHTFITDFIADSLAPHVLNVVQDPKTKYIPHKPYIYIGITTFWALYCSITQLFAIFIAFAQLDLLLVRLASDICANCLTTSLYLNGKEYNPTKYKIVEMREQSSQRQEVYAHDTDDLQPNNYGMERLDYNGNEDDQVTIINTKYKIRPLLSSNIESLSEDSNSNAKDSDALLNKQ
jgi:hypothetical protein